MRSAGTGAPNSALLTAMRSGSLTLVMSAARFMREVTAEATRLASEPESLPNLVNRLFAESSAYAVDAASANATLAAREPFNQPPALRPMVIGLLPTFEAPYPRGDMS